MLDVKEIARNITLAKGYLEDAHKAFNAAYADDRESVSGEEHKVWRASVDAIDALSPIEDWAIDNL